MGYFNKVKFWPNERLDLPDVNSLQDNVYSYLGGVNKKFVSVDSLIVSGFITANDGGTNVRVSVKDSVALNILGTNYGTEGVLWIGSGDLIIDPDLTSSLSAGDNDYYLEVNFTSIDTTSGIRAFWDPTANSNNGDEFTEDVLTCTVIKCNLVTSISTPTGNANNILIARVTVSGGAITQIRDERKLYFRSNSDYPWTQGRTTSTTDFLGADKGIKTEKEWKDAIMQSIKEIKGDEWYKAIGSGLSLNDLLKDRNYFLHIPSMEFNSTSGNLFWDTFRIIVPDNAIKQFTINASSVTIADEEILYVNLDRTYLTITLGTIKIGGGTLPLTKNTYVIGVRQGNLFVLRDGRVVYSPWIYDEKRLVSSDITPGATITLPTDSKDGGAERKYYVGKNQLKVFVNGVKLNSAQIVAVSSFSLNSYSSMTGFVSVSDSVDLSLVGRYDSFVDASSNTFQILGGISNTLGEKGFYLSTGLTVNTGSGAFIYKQEYREIGSTGSFSKEIEMKREVKTGTIINYVIDHLPSIVAGYPYNVLTSIGISELDGGTSSILGFSGDEDGGSSSSSFTTDYDGGGA